MQVETNIPVLMTGVTTIAILLPSVPTLIGPYLPDLFEIFNRLASFSVKKPGKLLFGHENFKIDGSFWRV